MNAVEQVTLMKYDGDVQQYLSLKNNEHVEYRESWNSHIKNIIKSNKAGKEDLCLGILYGLFSDGELIGGCRIVNSACFNRKRWLELYDYIILPKFRNYGFGKKMMLLLIEQIKESYPDKTTIVLNSRDAENFYKQLGFETLGVLDEKAFMYKHIK